MKDIVIVQPKTLKPEVKKKLEANGYLIIEHPSPQNVRIVSKFDIPNLTDGNDIFWSAIAAIMESPDRATPEFGRQILKRIKAKELKTQP